MSHIQLPQNRMTKTALTAFALVALAMLAYWAWTLSDDAPTVSAHSISQLDYYYPTMMPWPWGTPITVAMNTLASTTEHRSGSAMVTDGHTHSIHIPQARCGHNFYPTCFAYGNPKIRYYHATNSYTLQGSNHWDLQHCIGPVDDLVGCWISDTALGWFTIPINAAPNMVVIIAKIDYYWTSATTPFGRVLSVDSTVYQVD